MDVDEHDGVDALVGHLEDGSPASKIPSKRRQVSVKPTVEKVTSLLWEQGLLPDELERLLDLITLPSHLDQASRGALVRNLFPAAKVSDEAVLKVVGALGYGELKLALPLQNLLLRWLVMVCHVLEKPSILSQTYAVLFNLLDTAATRPQLCHLLALITRRKHVRPFRIHSILNLSRDTGDDPALKGLLRVFKNYYPEIIVGNVTKGRASAFKHPDPQWRSRLDELQQQRRSDARQDGAIQNGFSVKRSIGIHMRGQKTMIPSVHTFHANDNSVTLEEIDSAEALVRNLEKMELPNQLVAVMADPLLQKLMLLRPDAEASARVGHWIMACVGDVASGDADGSLLLDVIEVMHEYATTVKTLPPLFIAFLKDLFQVWNGVDKRDTVVELLTFVPLMEFQELYESILQPFEGAMLDNTPECQRRLLDFYASLSNHWIVIMRSQEDSKSTLVSRDAIFDLTIHINRLALTLSQTSPDRTGTHLGILDAYEHGLCPLLERPSLLDWVRIAAPPPLLIYTLHFTDSPAVLSRLCGLLAVYRRAWEASMASASTQRPRTALEQDHIRAFNCCLMDLCNCLWRGRALSRAGGGNVTGCRISPAVADALADYILSVDRDTDLALDALFDLSHAPALCLQSLRHVRALEEEEKPRERHRGPVTTASLTQLWNRGGLQLSWQAYRAGVLTHLEKSGFGGVAELMYNTMKVFFKNRGERKAKARADEKEAGGLNAAAN